MEPATVSSCILTLHRRFAAYTTQRLQELVAARIADGAENQV